MSLLSFAFDYGLINYLQETMIRDRNETVLSSFFLNVPYKKKKEKLYAYTEYIFKGNI